jgi:hypothetical protein
MSIDENKVLLIGERRHPSERPAVDTNYCASDAEYNN